MRSNCIYESDLRAQLPKWLAPNSLGSMPCPCWYYKVPNIMAPFHSSWNGFGLGMHTKNSQMSQELYQSARWMPGQTWHYQMPNWLDEGQNDKLCDDFVNPNSQDYLRPSHSLAILPSPLDSCIKFMSRTRWNYPLHFWIYASGWGNLNYRRFVQIYVPNQLDPRATFQQWSNYSVEHNKRWLPRTYWYNCMPC